MLQNSGTSSILEIDPSYLNQRCIVIWASFDLRLKVVCAKTKKFFNVKYNLSNLSNLSLLSEPESMLNDEIVKKIKKYIVCNVDTNNFLSYR